MTTHNKSTPQTTNPVLPAFMLSVLNTVSAFWFLHMTTPAKAITDPMVSDTKSIFQPSPLFMKKSTNKGARKAPRAYIEVMKPIFFLPVAG